jgi:outer membrane autotransporter protein
VLEIDAEGAETLPKTMKIHLPYTLLACLLACCASSSITFGDETTVTDQASTVDTQLADNWKAQDDAKSRIMAAKVDIARMESFIENAQVSIAQNEARLAKCTEGSEEYQQLKDSIASIEESMANYQEQLAQDQSDLETAQKDLETLKAERKELKLEYATLNGIEVISEDDDEVDGQVATSPQTSVVVPQEPDPTSATVNALGTAQRDALRSQILTIRDRVASLRSGQLEGKTQFWIEGAGSYNKLDERSGRGGYTLKTWGGSVGGATTIDNDLTLGAAFTATWGDISSTAGNERATGDLDSYYLSLFAHYQSNAWGHTLVLTGTTTDASLDRSGELDGEAYKTQGDTDGYGIGALYELTYDIKLNEQGTSVLQPLFDASIVHTSLDAYNETGIGNDTLHVGEQDWTTGSVAVGARWAGTFGSATVGQAFSGELRVAVSQDFGDTRGKTAISFVNMPGSLTHSYGVKAGTTAAQVGAGISTALSSHCALYANVGAEFRARENSVGGAVGVRCAF